jgi:hypothetical protein
MFLERRVQGTLASCPLVRGVKCGITTSPARLAIGIFGISRWSVGILETAPVFASITFIAFFA